MAEDGGTVTVTVIDAQLSQQHITISYGAVNKGDALAFGGTAPPYTKNYGDSTFDIAGLTYDGGNGDVSYSYVSGPGSLSGTMLTITGAGTIVLRATGVSANYNTKMEDFSITVNKKIVTINPTYESNTKAYGDLDPTLAYTHSGLVVGDSLSGSVLTRSAGENTGSYPISLSEDAATSNPNYQLTLASGNHFFTITKKSITVIGVTINAKPYDGTTAIELDSVTSVTFDGLVNSETLALNSDFEVTLASFTLDAYADTGKAATIQVILKNTTKSNNYECIDSSYVYTLVLK